MATKSPSSRSATIIWPLIAFVVSAAVGGWISTEWVPAKPPKADGRLINAADAQIEPRQQKQRAFSTDEEMLTAVMSGVTQEEPLLRAHQLHGTLGKLSSAELSILFAKAVQLEDSDRRQSLLEALLTHWALVDPDAARAAIRPYLERLRSAIQIDWRDLDAVVCRAWVQVFPEEILTTAATHPNERWAQTLAFDALLKLYPQDPARRLEALSRFPECALRTDLLTWSIKALAEKDFSAAEASLDLISDKRKRTQLQAEILGVLAGRDPTAGLAQLDRLASSLSANIDSMRLITQVLRSASAKDPEASMAAAARLPSSVRTQALGMVLVGWAEEHPVDALNWAASNGVDVTEAKGFLDFGENNSMSWRTLVGTAFGEDWQKTMEWVRTQPASAERDSMLSAGLWNSTVERKIAVFNELTPAGQVDAARALVRSSLRYGDSGAGEIEPWVQALPVGAVRSAAIQAFTDSQVRANTKSIDELAAAWTPGPDRDAAMRGIASSLSDRDPRRALEVARQVNDPTLRESAFEKIAQSWVYKDKSAALAWIASATELSPEQKRVLLRQAEER